MSSAQAEGPALDATIWETNTRCLAFDEIYLDINFTINDWTTNNLTTIKCYSQIVEFVNILESTESEYCLNLFRDAIGGQFQLNLIYR